jgi:hypothetical protein
MLADDQLEDPVYDNLEKEAIKLVDRAANQDKLDATIDLDSDGSEIPEELRRDITMLTDRVARCYLRSSTSDPNTVSESPDSEHEAPPADVSQSKEQADVQSEGEAWQQRAMALIAEQLPHSDMTDVGDGGDDTHQDGITEATVYDISNSVNVPIDSDNSKNEYHES